MKNKHLLFIAMLISFVWNNGVSKNPEILKDIHSGSEGSNPRSFTEYNNKLYFKANDGTYGDELWVYDGYTTKIAEDIWMGSEGGSPLYLTVYNNKLYFAANNGMYGKELWVYDGDSAKLVKDIYSGSDGSLPHELTVYNNKLYFRANNGTYGNELWVHDGKDTWMVKDINNGSSGSAVNAMAVYNNKLYFAASDGIYGKELWMHDSYTTEMVQDIWSGSNSSLPHGLTVYNNKLFFQAETEEYGKELWVFDGDTATLVKDIKSGSSSSYPRDFTVYNNKLYFAADNGTNGDELWVYDGNSAEMFKDLHIGSEGSDPDEFTVHNNKLYFTTNEFGFNGLWIYDNYEFKKISDLQGFYSSNGPDYLTVYNNRLYFAANDGETGLEPWVYCEPSYSTRTVESCETYTAPSGKIWTESGTYTDTIPNYNGCDSIITIYLTINEPLIRTDVITACDSYNWIDGYTYTESNNTAEYIIKNEVGCDSIIKLDLTIYKSTTWTDVITACDSYTWIDGYTYTESNNTAEYIIKNEAGCDSIIKLDLTIYKSPTYTDVITACKSYTWIDGYTYTESNNTAEYIIKNEVGCDSIIKLDLTIYNTTTWTDVVTACKSYTWIDGYTYTESNNTAEYIINNENGCDSIIKLDLTIYNTTTWTDKVTACDSYTWIDGYTYTESNNTAEYVINNENGCDSIIKLDLTIWESTESTITVYETGDSYTAPDGYIYTTEGTYTATIKNDKGCDSTITIKLYFDEASGLQSIEDKDITIYPNPSDGTVYINHEIDKSTMVKVYSTTGNLIYSKNLLSRGETRLDLDFEPGVYTLFVIPEGRNPINLKLILQ
ncbi:MAG: T9SS type A sorting domain-containing protein [Bacteroidales bacterium]|nr:T9SS type A sorting domain-containing protein [Bacteroidales bacterium]